MNHHLMKPKCRSLLAGICANCTKFAIDDYSYMYSDVVRPFPWENRDRPILVSYIGSTRSYYGPARKLRGSIVHYCGLHEDCVHQSYGLNGTRHSFKVDGHHPLQISQRSVFCFQPIGDLMTRKGLFDSLLQGCIPVVFDALTASVMYTWHWEETFWNKIMVEFLAHPTTHRYFDPVAALRVLSLNTTLIQEKQALIRERVFELQYGLDGYEDLYQHASRVPYLSLSTQKGELGEGEGGAVGERIVHTTLTGPVKSARGTSWPLRADGTPLRDAGESADVRVGTVPECWDGYLDKMMNKCRPGKEPAPPT
ncbi:hypothetical protein B484DRAFT_432852 [Ochromonadaceae sp. CCMP2298]|nr:hypothetical protein B484DRAFT_432852 [Ochromonadaceae sp. CCMP2298]